MKEIVVHRIYKRDFVIIGAINPNLGIAKPKHYAVVLGRKVDD